MRERILPNVIASLFVLIITGLFYTQIMRFPYYSRLSKNNSIRIIPIDGPRGNIYDRNNVPMVSNRLSFDVTVVYQELRNRAEFFRLLKESLGFSGSDVADAMDKVSKKPYSPVAIVEDLEKDKALELEEESVRIDGLSIETRSRRDYLYKTAGAHMFGYLGEITENELEDLKDYGYRPRDLIGRGGIEKYYDIYLKGMDGGTQVEVDNRGRQMRVLGVKEPSSGKDLYLTVDLRLQLACDKLLGDHKGAIVAMDPKTGEILALSSHPAFDPNIFVRPDASGRREALIGDKTGRPISNRAISGLYSPGSVFKIVTSSAALETKRINLSTRFFCGGSYRLGSAKFDCWKDTGHGSQNVKEALMNSCNVFFYNTGRLVGVDNMEAFTKLFGFGRPTGIDLPDEVKGVVPGRAWKTARGKGAWYEGETINYAIGQGYLLVTPIQVVNMTAVIANGGSLVKPHIVKKIGKDDLVVAKPKSIGLKDSTIRVIREGLFEVVNNEFGTGKRAKVEGVVVAGKTGTAQNPQGRTHAWFTGYAPYENPAICIVVFLEHGGKGGLEPASIGRDIFMEAKNDGYFK